MPFYAAYLGIKEICRRTNKNIHESLYKRKMNAIIEKNLTHAIDVKYDWFYLHWIYNDICYIVHIRPPCLIYDVDPDIPPMEYMISKIYEKYHKIKPIDFVITHVDHPNSITPEYISDIQSVQISNTSHLIKNNKQNILVLDDVYHNIYNKELHFESTNCIEGIEIVQLITDVFNIDISLIPKK